MRKSPTKAETLAQVGVPRRTVQDLTCAWSSAEPRVRDIQISSGPNVVEVGSNEPLPSRMATAMTFNTSAK